MEMQAAVFRKVHEPLTIESVEIDKPWGREVLVRTAATGVCHSDLHVVDGFGRFPLDRPIVLGHEGSGVVEAGRIGCMWPPPWWRARGKKKVATTVMPSSLTSP